MMFPCRFTTCNKCTIPARDTNNGEVMHVLEYMGNLCIFCSILCELKTTLKRSLLQKMTNAYNSMFPSKLIYLKVKPVSQWIFLTYLSQMKLTSFCLFVFCFCEEILLAPTSQHTPKGSHVSLPQVLPS